MALQTIIANIPVYPDRVVDACATCGCAYVVWSPWPGVVPYSGNCSCANVVEHKHAGQYGIVVPGWGG